MLLAQYIETFYFGGIGKPSVTATLIENKADLISISRHKNQPDESKGRSVLEIESIKKSEIESDGNVVDIARKIIVDDDGNIIDQNVRGSMISKSNLDLAVDIELMRKEEEETEERMSDDGDFNYLDIVREKKAAEEAKIVKVAAVKKASKDRHIKEWLDWKCLTCNLENRLPRHPLEYPDYNVSKNPSGVEKMKGEVYFESLGRNFFLFY